MDEWRHEKGLNKKRRAIKEGRYTFRGKQKEKKEQEDWKQNESNKDSMIHSMSWEDINLETGEILHPSIEISEEDDIQGNDISCIDDDIKLEDESITLDNLCEGLKEVKQIFEKLKIPLFVSEGSFRLDCLRNKSGISLSCNSNTLLQIDEFSEKPKGIKLGFKYKSGVFERKKDLVPMIDNNYRNCIIYERKRCTFLCHCGWSNYSLSYMMKILQNPSSLLNVSPSRIKLSGRYVEVDVTINQQDVERLNFRTSDLKCALYEFGCCRYIDKLICNFEPKYEISLNFKQFTNFNV